MEKAGKGVADRNVQLMCNAPGVRKRQEEGRKSNQAMVGLNTVTIFEVILMGTNYNFLGFWSNS